MKSQEIFIFTDGGYRPLFGVGAYAFAIREGTRRERYYSGIITSKLPMSSNYVEFTSFLKAMDYLKSKGVKRQTKITLFTDSLNLKNVFDEEAFFFSCGKLCKKIVKFKKHFVNLQVIWVPRNKLFEQKNCDRRCNELLNFCCKKANKVYTNK